MGLLNNIYVILVEPLYGGNMGSTARAMKNMGLEKLILVSPREDHLGLEARKMAVSAFHILENAEVYYDLKQAVSDFAYIAATTTRKRKGFPYRYTPQGAAPRILDNASRGKTGIMFGREDKGLFNDEIMLSTEIVTIPASPGLTSLNLAQAVLVVTYEVFKIFNPGDISPVPEYRQAELGSKLGYMDHLERVLKRVGFFHSSSRDHVMHTLKDMLERSFPGERDIRILRGMLRQFEWYMDQKKGEESGS